ncbi:pentatricopeptide repeat-containing protein [Quercus suber]|uniref:Pentatricopeptide repeat-containing protein n=1 Tax=Quercus suber TaxID=58331 RepID=A0AAW0M3P3_QUESU
MYWCVVGVYQISEIIESLVSMCKNLEWSSLVFDLLIRTYVQARKLREGPEVFCMFRSKGFCVSINACNCPLGGLVKVGRLGDWIPSFGFLEFEMSNDRGTSETTFSPLHNGGI